MANISSKEQQTEITMWGRRKSLLKFYSKDFYVFMHSSQFAAKQLGVIFPTRRVQHFKSLKPRNALFDAMKSSINPQSNLLCIRGFILKFIEKIFSNYDKYDHNRRNFLPIKVLSQGNKLPKLWTFVNTLTGGHTRAVYSVAFHSRLPILATGSMDFTAKLWKQSSDGSLTQCVATLQGHEGWVHSVAFHSSLPILATGSDDGTTKLWKMSSDGSNATCVATLEGHGKAVRSVAFHSSLPILATGSNDKTAKLWKLSSDGSNATCVATLNLHKDLVCSVAFHQTAPILATGSFDHTTKLWLLSSGLSSDELKPVCVATHKNSSWVNSVAFNSKGSILAMCCYNNMNLWS